MGKVSEDFQGITEYTRNNPHKHAENVIKEYISLVDRAFHELNDIDLGLEIGTAAKKYILEDIKYMTNGLTFKELEEMAQKRHDNSLFQICTYYDVLRLEAPHWLDSFKLYIERDRKRKDRFYEPRRNTLIKITDAVQRLEDDKLDMLFLHQPPRTGKSGDLTMDTVWHMLRDTEHSNLYITYKEGLGGAFLDGCMEILTDPTYRTADVFNIKIASTDAKNNKLDLGRKKKYKTLSGKGLESGLNGEYDAYGWMVIDDPLEGVQDVMSDDVLKRKQTIFDNNVLSRKKESCKLICMGTLWSTHDLFMNYLDFVENSPEMADTRYEVIKIPALDPETDESNFNYDYNVGFSTKYFRGVRAKFENNDDLVGWQCQYMQQPIEREGSVFNPEHMNYYSVLPGEKPLKVIAHVDVSLGGADFLAMPVVYYYENGDGELDGYVEAVIFDNSEKTVTQPQVISLIKKHIIKHLHFEANQGGEGYADDIRRMLKEDKDYREICNITTDWAMTTKHKEQRIWDNAAEIRKLYFKDANHRDLQYRKFMNNLFSFSMNMSKRKHDDAADSLSGLIDFEKHGTGIRAAKIISSPI